MRPTPGWAALRVLYFGIQIIASDLSSSISDHHLDHGLFIRKFDETLVILIEKANIPRFSHHVQIKSNS